MLSCGFGVLAGFQDAVSLLLQEQVLRAGPGPAEGGQFCTRLFLLTPPFSPGAGTQPLYLADTQSVRMWFLHAPAYQLSECLLST